MDRLKQAYWKFCVALKYHWQMFHVKHNLRRRRKERRLTVRLIKPIPVLDQDVSKL